MGENCSVTLWARATGNATIKNYVPPNKPLSSF
jgi:hypothetical protein